MKGATDIQEVFHIYKAREFKRLLNAQLTTDSHILFDLATENEMQRNK